MKRVRFAHGNINKRESEVMEVEKDIGKGEGNNERVNFLTFFPLQNHRNKR